MKKRDYYIILAILVIGIALPFVINILMTNLELINTIFSNDSWLGFWGSYISGVFAGIIAYLAIIFSNRNSEDAIKYNTKVLEYQFKNESLNKYRNCLINNVDVLEISDIAGSIACLNLQNLHSAREKIIKKMSSVSMCKIQYSSTSMIDVIDIKSVHDKEYDDLWSCTSTFLMEILVQQMTLVNSIDDIQRTSDMIDNINRQLANYTRILELESKQQERNRIQLEIITLKTQVRELEEKRKAFNDNLPVEIDNLNRKINELRISKDKLFDLSIMLIKEKTEIVKKVSN